MNVISYTIIEPIARRIRRARLERKPVQLSVDQVTLLDEWMQSELELQADAEYLAHAVAEDNPKDFIPLDDVEAALEKPEADDDNAV